MGRQGFHPEPWRWLDRPRVLIEKSDSDAGLVVATALRRAGYTVAVCPGPIRAGEPPDRCPLVGPAGCALARGADLVVSSLGADRPETLEVLVALRMRYPRTPLVVEVPPGAEERYAELDGGCRLVPAPLPMEELVAIVGEELAADAVACRV